ncbi:MAG: tetratricopeptide repeat protein [Bacteroidota bacterium]|nr:tetratricopeptide repeat protein [Bacteroidota bacterium]
MQQITASIPQKWVYFLLIVLSFILYGNSINNDYCLDDNFVVTANPYVQKGFAGLHDITANPYAKIGNSTLDFRPYVLITFAIEQQFFTNNPHVSHFINILFYACCLIGVYRVLTKIFQLNQVHELLPFLITVLFAIHPIHTEVVNSLKNRDELMMMLFGLLFLLCTYSFFTGEWKKINGVLSIVFLISCLLSKITGIVYVGIFLMMFVYFRFYKSSKWNYAFVVLCLLVMVKYIIMVLADVKRVTIPFENPMQGNKDMLVNLATSLKILFYHLKMLVIPSPLLFYYGYNMFPLNKLSDPLAIVSLIIHTVALVYGVVRFFKRDILGFIILSYFASIFLYSNFPIPYTGMFAERTLFLSSLWFIAAIVIIPWRLFQKFKIDIQAARFKYGITFFLLIIFAFYSMATIRRNFLWKNNLVLMEHDIKYLKKSVLANYMYANNLRYQSSKSEDTAYAIQLANKAVMYYNHTNSIYSTYPETYYRLASTYRYNLNDFDKAEQNLKHALLLDSLYFTASFELAKLYLDKGDYKKGYEYFAKTHAINPKDSLTFFYYSQMADAVGDMNGSYRINMEFMKLYPKMQYAYMNLGKYYSKMRKDDTAVIYFEKAIDHGANSPQLLNQMAIYFDQKNDKQKADHYRSLMKPH